MSIKNTISRFFTDTRFAISWGILAIIVLAISGSVYLINSVDNDLDSFYKTITVEGQAEVFAVPDIATFTFSVTETEEDAATAQNNASEKVNAAIEYLKGEGIEDKDIKTTSYNSYPKYEWIQVQCITAPCQPGRQELVGYEVRQTISVKVRDTEMTGDLIAGIGGLDINTISGVTFTVDDMDSLEAEARDAAIADARAKAREMAKALGVRLDDVISFSEDSPYSYYDDYGIAEARSFSMEAGLGGAVSAPSIPTGENKVTSRVFVTFEID